VIVLFDNVRAKARCADGRPAGFWDLWCQDMVGVAVAGEGIDYVAKVVEGGEGFGYMVEVVEGGEGFGCMMEVVED
jgi:hypothetical protein